MPTPINSKRLGPAPSGSPRTVMGQNELKTLYHSRPAAQGDKPKGYLKDVNLPIDKPAKAISSPKKMGRR